MPYLESNQEVSENSTFNKALAIAGAVTFGAAAGQMAMEGLAKAWGIGAAKSNHGILAKLGEHATERDVLKSLYGGAEKNARNYKNYWKDLGENAIPTASEDGAQYALQTTGAGRPRFRRSDGSGFDRLKDNYLPKWLGGNQELGNLNKQMKNLWKNGDNLYKTKLDIYGNLAENRGNLNIGADDLVEATNKIYSGEGQTVARKTKGFDSKDYKEEIDWMNQMWDPVETKASQTEKIDTDSIQSAIASHSDDRLTDEQMAELGFGNAPIGEPISYKDTHNQNFLDTLNTIGELNNYGKTAPQYGPRRSSVTEPLPTRPSYTPPTNESDAFLGNGANNVHKTESSSFFAGDNGIPKVDVSQARNVSQREPHPYSQYGKNLNGKNIVPDAVLKPEEFNKRMSRIDRRMSNRTTNPANKNIEFNNQFKNDNIDNDGFYAYLNKGFKNGTNIDDYNYNYKDKYNRLKKLSKERKERLGLS